MHIPTTQEDLICELEGFLHTGTLTDEEHTFFEDFIQRDCQQWLALCDEQDATAFFVSFQNFLTVAAQLYQIEDLRTLILNALMASRHLHQLRPSTEAFDYSDSSETLLAFLETAAQRLPEDGAIDMDTIAPTEVVLAFLSDTPNKYLLINLLLCALKEDYRESYQEYVKGKVSRFTYTLAFWRPLANLFEPDCPVSHIAWMDLFSDLAAPKGSERLIRELVAQMETSD